MLTFLPNGNMFAGIVSGELIVRLGKAGAEAELRGERRPSQGRCGDRIPDTADDTCG